MFGCEDPWDALFKDHVVLPTNTVKNTMIERYGMKKTETNVTTKTTTIEMDINELVKLLGLSPTANKFDLSITDKHWHGCFLNNCVNCEVKISLVENT